jgi:hypothetical protein
VPDRPLRVLNADALRALASGRDIKLLMDEERLLLAYLNTQHTDLEKEVFGLDGTLRRTVPGYITANTRKVLLRRCDRYSSGGARGLKAQLEVSPELDVLAGFEVLYGNESLGVLRMRSGGVVEEEEEPEPVVWDLG